MIGGKAEIYWDIRIYELVREAGVQHLVCASSDYGLKKENYDPSFRCVHFDGKGKVEEFLSARLTELHGLFIKPAIYGFIL